jgi:hypothetical protein
MYKKIQGDKRIYSEIIHIDWYDGGVTGIFKLNDALQWYLFNLVFYDTKENIRFFSLIEVSTEWKNEVKSMMQTDGTGVLVNYDKIKGMIKNAFDRYTGDVFLLRARYIEDVQYEVIRMPLSSLKYFDKIEDTFNQDEKSIEKLKSFFSEG